jgi:hypothetical protein
MRARETKDSEEAEEALHEKKQDKTRQEEGQYKTS